ncbi:MAG: helix-turn-helix domain-containing protein [Pseudomonadota bacterium]
MKYSVKTLLYLLVGLKLMHDFAIQRGAQICSDGENLFVDKETYLSLIGSLPAALESTSERGFDFGSGEFLDDLKEALLEFLTTYCRPLFSLLLVGGNKPKVLIHRLNRAPFIHHIGGKLDPNEPEEVAKRGFHIIRNCGARPEHIPFMAIGITLIGWSSLALFRNGQCASCPRKSHNGSIYCIEHAPIPGRKGHSKSLLTRPRYRRGKQAKMLEAELEQPCSQITSDEESYEQLQRHKERMFQVLCPQRLRIPSDNSKELLHALERAPRTVSRLGGMSSLKNMSYDQRVERIRQKLMPFDDNEWALPSAIGEFEKNFTAEERIEQNKRGKGIKTARRILTATELASQGKSQKEIADHLGVAQSTVSAWVRKNPSFMAALTNPRTAP